MTLENRKKTKKILTISAAIIVFLFFIVFINILTRPSSDKAIRANAQSVLEHWSGSQVTLNNAVRVPGSGISYSRCYSATVGNTPAIVYIVTITGRAGPYSTVFCSGLHDQPDFCGILMYPDSTVSPIKFGITPVMISRWKNRIAALSLRTGVEHEK